VVARAVGLLFSLMVAGLSAWVSVGWSQSYVQWIAKSGNEDFRPFANFEQTYTILFGVVGLVVGFTLAGLMYRQALDLSQHLLTDLRRIPGRDKLAVVLGVFIGLGMTALLGSLLFNLPHYGRALTLLVGIVAVYLGVAISLSMKEELNFFFPGQAEAQRDEKTQGAPRAKLLDTNVIIDGRIADICRAGFLEGPIYIPGFVLDELHLIADSSDSLKRNRGRRGLDILNQMQQQPNLRVDIFGDYENPPRKGDPVDAKLIHLAKEIDGTIVTNDFNLNKVAQLQGIRVLNVNELANAVKPVVLPGEELSVTIVREGKEPEQGVAYLDDGTMVVVERGRELIGQTISITVTSVLQTVAGKMIFGSPQDVSRSAGEEGDSRQRGNSSGGPRRKDRSPGKQGVH